MIDSRDTDCPDDNVFFEMIEGRIDETLRQQLDDHLDQCASCAAFVIELAEVVAASAVGPDGDLQTGEGRALDVEQTPEKIGRYEIVRQVGQGAMGVVFEARDTMLDRRVAIKLLKLKRMTQRHHSVATKRMVR